MLKFAVVGRERMRLRKTLAYLTLTVGLAAAPASAVTVTFSGTVNSGFGSIANGALLTGTYDFDPTTPARAGSNANFAFYDAITALSFAVGGYSASASPTVGEEIQIDNDPGLPNNDRYGVTSRASDGLTGAMNGGLSLSAFSLRMDDVTDTVFSTALTLPTDPNLADFTSGSFFIFFVDQNGALGGIVSGTLDSLETVAQIPLPASLVLLFGAIAGLGLVSLRRPA